ncbi:MAG: cytochrome c oxidase assembly factor Coa1 family protein [Planctomycetia bacterium]
MSETPQNNEPAADAPTCNCGCPFTKRKVWIPLLIILILVILGFSFGKGQIISNLWNSWTIKGSDPYQKALKGVQADPKVVEKLGESVEADGWPSGELTELTCNIFFDITGPNGTGKVEAAGRASDQGVWTFNLLKVSFDEGEPIVVELPEEEGGLKAAQPFTPGETPTEDPTKTDSGTTPPAPDLQIDIPVPTDN